MVDYSFQYEKLNNILKLSTNPVAVKYLTNFTDDLEWELAEKGFYKPKVPLNLCQFIGLARHHSRSVIAVEDNLACKIGALGMGLYPFDEEMKKGSIAIQDGARRNDRLCAEMFRTLPKADYGVIKAIIFAPLQNMSLELDQIIFYGNPLEVLKIIQSYLWTEDARLKISTCGKYGVCVEGMANSWKSGKPSVGFPCRGERASSIVQDDELFLCLPGKYLDEVVDGLEKTRHLLPSPIPFNGVNQFPDFLPDYYLTERAKARQSEI